VNDPVTQANSRANRRSDSRRTVLLVDDQQTFRVILRALFEADPSYTVVGEAADGDQAVDLALTLCPDVVVMDVRLPGTNGIEATRRIIAGEPSTTVVLVSSLRRTDLPGDLLGCGAIGFLQKEQVDPIAVDRLLARR
jgi:two-component system, NarL family, invasion response regulator UvrY